ncbi:MAG: response regulator [Cyclobacteriaceae bacterium]|nr:response regulator [Cyclobacteriaceae bacterium]
MSVTCLIVEDEPLARNLLADYVKKTPSLQLVGTCANAMEALELLQKHPVELIFLDIQMPEITGITFLKILQKKPLVIFTTAYSQYALEGYELDVVDYLLKPITFERFLKAVDKAVMRLQSQHQPIVISPAATASDKPDFVFVKDGTKMVKVMLDKRCCPSATAIKRHSGNSLRKTKCSNRVGCLKAFVFFRRTHLHSQ